jgi:hypothetical protein
MFVAAVSTESTSSVVSTIFGLWTTQNERWSSELALTQANVARTATSVGWRDFDGSVMH